LVPFRNSFITWPPNLFTCERREEIVKAGRFGADTLARREQLYRRTHLDHELRAEKSLSRKRTNTTSSGGGEKRTANKICRVCGDKAFSYNFNVITCESCKAFFRRNANKEREIRCPFNEQCEINVVSRRFCQRCRLAKCFGVGMKKEWIMSDEARLEKKQRVEENRERRMADAIARAEAVEDDDLQNDIDVQERIHQHALLNPESYPDQVKTGMKPEETPLNIKPLDELLSSNVTQEHSTVSIVVSPLLEAGSTAGLLVIPSNNPVDPSFMAQAQLAAAAAAQVQVQAAIKQHQVSWGHIFYIKVIMK
uniref:Nuclear receptor domain-containing protein n=1 Tax=Angiostrongylus cantonensis TaxID=6313 RepID=A0A0K0DP96_ANGCA